MGVVSNHILFKQNGGNPALLNQCEFQGLWGFPGGSKIPLLFPLLVRDFIPHTKYRTKSLDFKITTTDLQMLDSHQSASF